MRKGPTAQQISMWVSVADLKRTEHLRPKIGKGSTLGRVSRSEVLRLAITRGLDALEQEYR